MVVKVYNGKDCSIKAGGSTIGYAESFSVEVNTNIEGLFQLGQRTATHYKNGRLEITGTLEEYTVDWSYTSGIASSSIDTYDITGTLTRTDNSAWKIYLASCIFTDWSMDVPEDDMVTESLDFTAQDVTLSASV